VQSGHSTYCFAFKSPHTYLRESPLFSEEPSMARLLNTLVVMAICLTGCEHHKHNTASSELLPLLFAPAFQSSCTYVGFCQDNYTTAPTTCGANGTFSRSKCSCANAVGTCFSSDRYDNTIYYLPTQTSATAQAGCVSPNTFSFYCVP